MRRLFTADSHAAFAVSMATVIRIFLLMHVKAHSLVGIRLVRSPWPLR